MSGALNGCQEGSGGTPGSGGTSGSMPACAPAVVRGGACTDADQQLCYETCGPDSTGVQSEACLGGSYSEMSCSFDPTKNYVCYRIPSVANAGCLQGVTPQANAACTSLSCQVCNSLGGLLGGVYRDSSGATETGFCVCSAGAGGAMKWSCARNTAWPCPNGLGCEISGGAGTTGAAGAGAAGTTGLGGTTGAAGTSGAAGHAGATGLGGTTGAAGTTGLGGSTGGGGGAGTTGTAGSTGRGGTTGAGGTGGSVVPPTCPSTVMKGGACLPTDIQSCNKSCGPEITGAKSETCTAGVYAEMAGCSFDPSRNYSCYKIPATAVAACGAGATPRAGTSCAVSHCTICNSTGGLPGGHYTDTDGADKMGYCVCQEPSASGARTWSCAPDTEWPCPDGRGC